MQLAMVLAIGLLMACGKRTPAPEPTREPPAIDAPPAPVADAAIVIDAATAVDAAPGEISETPGTGKCKVDADCELSTYQAGCCTQGCEPYARNKRELELEMAAEQATCEKFRKSGQLCPPPAPCRPQTHDILAAKCVKNSCYTVKRKLPQKP